MEEGGKVFGVLLMVGTMGCGGLFGHGDIPQAGGSSVASEEGR